MRRLIAFLTLLLLPSLALAQSAPNPPFGFGFVPTPGQWNSFFQAKQDVLGFVPLNKAGDVMGGRLTLAPSTTAAATITIPAGTAPSAPRNGDFWATAAGLFYYQNGVAYGPLGILPCPVCASINTQNVFTSLQEINLNAAALPPLAGGTALQIGNQDGQGTRVLLESFGATSHFTGRRADGTNASKTALTTNDEIVAFNAWGYNGSGYVGPQGTFHCFAAQTWSSSALGTYCSIGTTPQGSTAIADIVTFNPNGGITVGNPTGGSQGVGTLNLQGALYINGVAAGGGSVTSVVAGSGLSGGNITGTGTIASYFDPGSITNCTLAASVSSNNLTIALKNQAGADPSSSAPCTVSFRDATASTGGYTAVNVTAATNVTFNSGSNLQASVNSRPFRVWVTAFNNAGTVVLAAGNQATIPGSGLNGLRLFPLDEAALQNTTACNACTNANSVGQYSTSAMSAKAMRVLGYMTWETGLPTAGAWSTGPTKIQMMGPGVKRIGESLQAIEQNTSTSSTTTSLSFAATSLVATIQPTSGANVVRVSYVANLGNSANNGAAIGQMFGNVSGVGPTNLLYNATTGQAGLYAPASATFYDAPLACAVCSVTSMTYTYEIKTTNASATTSLNGSGNSENSWILLEEIMG